ncbi:MAG: hypothetical protein HW422_2093 [Cutibacterium acnes]|nr:hypothetical protein [Cutibacterium acnes]
MFTVDVVKIVGLSLLRHSVRNVSFQRFLVGIAAILLLLPPLTLSFASRRTRQPLGRSRAHMSTSGSSTVTIYPTTMATLMIIWSRLCARIW